MHASLVIIRCLVEEIIHFKIGKRDIVPTWYKDYVCNVYGDSDLDIKGCLSIVNCIGKSIENC